MILINWHYTNEADIQLIKGKFVFNQRLGVLIPSVRQTIFIILSLLPETQGSPSMSNLKHK